MAEVAFLLRDWDPDKHPRVPAGSGGGGQFTSGGEGDGPAALLVAKPVSGGHAGKSLEQLQAHLTQRYGATVSVEEGVNAARARDLVAIVAESMDRMADDSLALAERLSHSAYGGKPMTIEVVQGRLVHNEEHGGNALGNYAKQENVLRIASGLNAARPAALPHIGAELVGTDFRTVINHELGHAVSGRITLLAAQAGTLAGADLFNSKPKTYWAQTVSRYATKNSREFMAEAVATYFHPGYTNSKGLPLELRAVFSAVGLRNHPVKSVVYLDTKYSDDQPRDEHGRWTSGGPADVAPTEPAPVKPPFPHDPHGITEWDRFPKKRAERKAAMELVVKTQLEALGMQNQKFVVKTTPIGTVAVMGPTAQIAGQYHPGATGGKLIFTTAIDVKVSTFESVVRHEAAHARFEYAQRHQQSRNAIADLVMRDHSRLRADGGIMSPYAAAWWKRESERGGYTEPPRNASWATHPTMQAVNESLSESHAHNRKSSVYQELDAIVAKAYAKRPSYRGMGVVFLDTKYSDEQPRDEHGRWSSGGGGSQPRGVAGEAAVAVGEPRLGRRGTPERLQIMRRAVSDELNKLDMSGVGVNVVDAIDQESNERCYASFSPDSGDITIYARESAWDNQNEDFLRSVVRHEAAHARFDYVYTDLASHVIMDRFIRDNYEDLEKEGRTISPYARSWWNKLDAMSTNLRAYRDSIALCVNESLAETHSTGKMPAAYKQLDDFVSELWNARKKGVVYLDTKYSDDQPRDEHGRWSSGGGGSSSGGELLPATPAEERIAAIQKIVDKEVESAGMAGKVVVAVKNDFGPLAFVGNHPIYTCAEYNPRTNNIIVYAPTMDDEVDKVSGVIRHELSHARFYAVKNTNEVRDFIDSNIVKLRSEGTSTVSSYAHSYWKYANTLRRFNENWRVDDTKYANAVMHAVNESLAEVNAHNGYAPTYGKLRDLVNSRYAALPGKGVVYLDTKYSDDQPRDEHGRWTPRDEHGRWTGAGGDEQPYAGSSHSLSSGPDQVALNAIHSGDSIHDSAAKLAVESGRLPIITNVNRIPVIKALAEDELAKIGMSGFPLTVVDGRDISMFALIHGEAVASYSTVDKEIRLFSKAPRGLDDIKEMRGIVRHEAMHARFDYAKTFGTVAGFIDSNIDSLISEDGITKYSRSWWTRADHAYDSALQSALKTPSRRDYQLGAINESLAEMHRIGRFRPTYKQLNTLVASAWANRAKDLRTKYSDDQPRDEHGRWSESGGVGGGESTDRTSSVELGVQALMERKPSTRTQIAEKLIPLLTNDTAWSDMREMYRSMGTSTSFTTDIGLVKEIGEQWENSIQEPEAGLLNHVAKEEFALNGTRDASEGYNYEGSTKADLVKEILSKHAFGSNLSEAELKDAESIVTAGYRSFLRAVYTTTQAELESAGLKDVTLFRGQMVYGPRGGDPNRAGPPSAGRVVLKMNPISSFSARVEVAREFADAKSGSIMAMRVPAKSILSLGGVTGFGMHSQREVLVLGGKHAAMRAPTTKLGNVTSANWQERFSAVVKSTLVEVELDTALEDAEWIKFAGKKKGVAYLAKYSDDQPRDEHGRWTDSGGEMVSGAEMVSPNVKENLDFDQALAEMHGSRQREVLAKAQEVDSLLGLPTDQRPALGAWSDGAENSIVGIVSGRTTYEQIELSAAMKGMLADQKAVIPFHVEPNGKDAMYRFEASGDLRSVHDQLMKDGIEYHTLQPVGNGIRVWVFDKGTEIPDKVRAAGERYGQQVEVWQGRGEFVGGDTRDAGREVYQGIIERSLEPDRRGQWQRLYGSWRETHPVLHSIEALEQKRAAAKAPLYVERLVENSGAIGVWAKANGIELAPVPLHVTIVYSNTPVAWSAVNRDTTTLSLPDDPKRTLKVLGEGDGVLVLMINSPELQARHEVFAQAGASWDYPSYLPHITLCTAKGVQWKNVKPYSGPIELGPEAYAEINPDAGVQEKGAEWDPEKHPRDEHGRWSETDGADGAGSEPSPAATSISGIPKDVPLPADLQEAVNRGAFTLTAKEAVGEFVHPGERFDITIMPKGVPDSWGTDESGARFDPQYMHVDESGRAIPNSPDVYNEPDGTEAGYVFRGMSYDEYRDSMQRGYFETRGGYNLGTEQEGLTYFSTDKGQAAHYASGFAPWQYIATPERPAIMVQVRDPGNHVRVAGTGEEEVGLRGRISTKEMVAYYSGDPIKVKAGHVDLNIDRWGGRVNASTGSRLSPSVLLRWNRHDVPAKAVYLDIKGDWDPDLHPRDEHGRFAHSGGAEGSESSDRPQPGRTSRKWTPLDPGTFFQGSFAGKMVDVNSLSRKQKADYKKQLDDLRNSAIDNAHLTSSQEELALDALYYAEVALKSDMSHYDRILAVENGQVRGGISGHVFRDDKDEYWISYLGSLQRGAGSKLLAEAEERALKHGCTRVGLYYSNYAAPFYKHNGYTINSDGEAHKNLIESLKAVTPDNYEEPIGILASDDEFDALVDSYRRDNAKGVVYLDTKFREDQPRDEHGRWADLEGGGSRHRLPKVSDLGGELPGGAALRVAAINLIVQDELEKLGMPDQKFEVLVNEIPYEDYGIALGKVSPVAVFDPNDSTIRVWQGAFSFVSQVKETIRHEASHAQFDKALKSPRPDYIEFINSNREALETVGKTISNYAASWWRHYDADTSRTNRTSAINESLAEARAKKSLGNVYGELDKLLRSPGPKGVVYVTSKGDWDPEKHPRAPGGSSEGGQFVSGGAGSSVTPNTSPPVPPPESFSLSDKPYVTPKQEAQMHKLGFSTEYGDFMRFQERNPGRMLTPEEYSFNLDNALNETQRLVEENGLKLPKDEITVLPYGPNNEENGAGADTSFNTEDKVAAIRLLGVNGWNKIVNESEIGPTNIVVPIVGNPLAESLGFGENVTAPCWTVAQREGVPRDVTTLCRNVFRHELGHALAGLRDIPAWCQNTFFTPSGNPRAGIGKTLTPAWAARNISAYGASSVPEAVAEIFAVVTDHGYVRGTLPSHFEKMVDYMLTGRTTTRHRRDYSVSESCNTMQVLLKEALGLVSALWTYKPPPNFVIPAVLWSVENLEAIRQPGDHIEKDWDPEKHPRDEHGRFTHDGGGGASSGSDTPSPGKVPREWTPLSPGTFYQGSFKGSVLSGFAVTEEQLDDFTKQLDELHDVVERNRGLTYSQRDTAHRALSYAQYGLGAVKDNRADGREKAAIAVSDGKIRGGVVGYVDRDDSDAFHVSWLGSLQRGAGSQLLKEMEDNARALGCNRVELTSTNYAESFYRHHGYKVSYGEAVKYLDRKASSVTALEYEEPIGTLALDDDFYQRVEADMMKNGVVYLDAKADWDPEKHPRVPSGEGGGQFTSGGGAIGAAAASEEPITGSYGAFNRDEWMAMPMGERRSEWAKLSDEERDAMADPVHAIPERVQEILGKGKWTDSGDTKADIETRVGQYRGDLLSNESADKVVTYAQSAHDALTKAGAKPEEVRELSKQITDVLIAQDYESVGRSLGDHGIHHIAEDARVANEVLALRGQGHDAREEALIYITAAFHDAGYLTDPSRAFLDTPHTRWGTQAYEKNVAPLVTKAFDKDFSNTVASTIFAHDDTDLDWDKEPLRSAFSLADNLALFHAEKMPPLLRLVPGNTSVLVGLGRGTYSLQEAHRLLRDNISASKLPSAMKLQLYSAAGEISPVSPKLALGMVGTKLDKIEWKVDHPSITIRRFSSNEALSKVLDCGQKQFSKLAETYKVNPAVLTRSGRMTLRKNGKTLFEASIISKLKKLLGVVFLGDRDG